MNFKRVSAKAQLGHLAQGEQGTGRTWHADFPNAR